MTVHVLVMILAMVGLVAYPLLSANAEGTEEAQATRTTVRIAQMHAVPEKWNLEKNFATFLALLEKAGAENPDIFITPEGWLDGYAAPHEDSTPAKLREVAQDPQASEYLKVVSEQAAKRDLHICFGFTSLEDGRIFNAAGLWGPDGSLIGIYHKTHLQRHDLQYTPGEALPVWPTPWGPVGIMICADRRWPETARCLRLQGAKLILNPTYGFRGELNEAMIRTRGYENQCYVAFTHPGESLVTGPKGGVVGKEVSETPGVLVTELDLTRARDDNHIADRRPDLYGVITRVP